MLPAFAKSIYGLICIFYSNQQLVFYKVVPESYRNTDNYYKQKIIIVAPAN